MLQNGEQAKEEACKLQPGLKDASRNLEFTGPRSLAVPYAPLGAILALFDLE